MPFTTRLNVVPIPAGFMLPQFTQYNEWYMELPANSIDSYVSTTKAFIAKYSTSITNKQDERALMDLEQRPHESLRDFHERYKAN
ncbi:hypothetical protein LIER_13946 [Lithospermum erythrorhizon]|uniref:Retrotransposon gag domain-containing protein n=1 Tax=Lithospermum erythrorhizon TaxID=34254 RepID=A0AAV3PZ82_LITER